MAMQTLDVARKDHGQLWTRKPIPVSDNGLLLKITRSASDALDLYTRNVRFLHASFDIHGNSFIAGDYQGYIYHFDLSRNRFNVVQKTGSSCTALAYALRRRTEYLVGMSDYSLNCYDTESRELVACLKGHIKAIQNISIHASGRLAVTNSTDTAFLWDLDTFKLKHKLNVERNVGIVKAFFLPLSNTILTCFKDGAIFGWDVDTLSCKFQLPVPTVHHSAYKAVAATRHGRLLVAGGKSQFLQVYDLDTRRLLRILQLPNKVKAVRQLEFLPDSFDGGANQVLGVLCQDGLMRFINIHTSKLLFDIGSVDSKLNHVTISPNGKHIVGVTEDGDLNLYSVEDLYAEANQPPPPLVKVVKSNKMADSSGEAEKPRKRMGRKRQTPAIDAAQADTSAERDLPGGMSIERLMRILRQYGEYPEKYRMFIWRSILKLPENHAALAALVDKGTHPSYENLHETYPIKSRKLLRVLQRTLSALAHWSPLFGETDYLPMLAFPFVKLFQNNQLICFEMVATLLLNWCQHWFEYFPNPPINVLGMVENLLAFHDKELLRHFVHHGVTSQVYAWPLMQTVLSEVFTREEWLRLFDNVFSNPPSFLLMVVAAYSICSRGALLRCNELEDFKFFFHHRNAVDIGQVINEAYHLVDVTPEDTHPDKILEEFSPLTLGQYPVFNKYPKFIVDYQVQERERIRQEEMEYLRQRHVALELQQDRQKRQTEEEAWYRQQQLLLEAEERRRKLIQQEEDKLAQQRTKLQTMNREVKQREMQILDATRQKFREFQQQKKEAEIRRLDDELRRKTGLRDTETQAAIDDAEVRNMELAMQKAYLEQELMRTHVDSDLRQEAELNVLQKQEQLEKSRQTDTMKDAELRELYTKQELQRILAGTDQEMEDAYQKTLLEQHRRLDDLDREQRLAELIKIQQMNQSLEDEVGGLMEELNLSKKKAESMFTRQLVEEKDRAHRDEERRLHLMQDQVNAAKDNLAKLERTRRLMEDQRHTVDSSYERHDKYLNESTTTSDTSAQFSLDRGRQTLDERERELMTEVMRLRRKLATESRNKKPPPASSVGV